MTPDELNQRREGWDFEAKLAAGRDGRGTVPGSFWETYVAMANTSGGLIALGVRELEGGRLDAVGLADAVRVERELWDQLENREKVSVNLLGRGDVTREELDGRVVLLVTVPRAPRTSRPVFLGSNVWSGTFHRTHEGDRRIRDRDRIRRMIADAEYTTRDDRVLPRFGLADIAPETLSAYRNLFRTTRVDHPWTALDDGEFLQMLGAWRRNRETGESGLTVAGLLLFGRSEAIVEALPNFFVDYQERRSGTGAIEWSDRVVPDGRWSGNVCDFYRKVVTKLTADVKVPFQLGLDLYRRDDTHVHEALREALVNALIHADYEGTAPVLIVKEAGRFVFRNPGTPRISLAQIHEGGHSDCRNRTLQTMFLMLGIGEKAGSGFSRIERAWREEQWVAPALEADEELETTTLTLSTVSLVAEAVVSQLRRRFGGALGELSGDAQLALALAQEHGTITHDAVKKASTSHARDITLVLHSLVRKRMLERRHEGRTVFYSLPSLDAERSIHSSSQNSSHSSSHSSAQGDLYAVVSKGKRASVPRDNRDVIDNAIVAFCAREFRPADAIATVVGRALKTVRAHYLGRLASAGRLELLHPDAPNHPGQAYRAKSSADAGATSE